MRRWPGAALAPMLLIGAVVVPSLAMGQVVLGQLTPPVEKEAEIPAEGYYVTPSLSIGELYDDNLFFAPTDRQQDFFTRISPGLTAGYQSTPLTLLAGYSFDSEIYSKHPELTTNQMRQNAVLELTARPTRLLALAAKGTYSKTRTPWQFNTFTGVAIRRVRAERIEFNPSMTYRQDPLTTATGDYSFSRQTIVGSISIDSHIVNLGLDRRITETDTLTPGYIGRRFEFDGLDSITSHAFTLGWRHNFTPLTTLTLRGGPRVTEGALDDWPEALVSLQHRLTRGEVALTYGNILTTVVGQPEKIMAQSLSATIDYELTPRLRVIVGPTAVRVTAQTFRTTVYVSNAELTYQVNKWLALKGSHQFSLMRGSFNPLTGGTGGTVEVPHNMVWLRLVVTYPFRLE